MPFIACCYAVRSLLTRPHRLSCDLAVFEMCEDKRSFDDAADSAGTGGDASQNAPTSSEHGESPFTQAAQTPEQGVAGTIVECLTGVCTPIPAPP